MSNKIKAIGAILLCSFFWSGAGVMTKILYKFFDPFPLAFLRFLIAFLVILPFFLRQKLGRSMQLIIRFLPVAMFSTGNIFFYYLGIYRTSVIASTIIYTATPFVVTLLARFLINEKLTIKKITGITIGFIGVIFISVIPLIGKDQRSAGDLIGNLLIFIAMISWSIYTVGSRHFITKYLYSPLTMSVITFFCSMFIFGILTFLIPHRNITIQLININNLILLGYLSVFMTVFVFLLFQWAVKFSSATIASMNTYLQPVFGVILAMVILKEKFTIEYMIGSLLIIIGLIITSNIKIWKLKVG